MYIISIHFRSYSADGCQCAGCTCTVDDDCISFNHHASYACQRPQDNEECACIYTLCLYAALCHLFRMVYAALILGTTIVFLLCVCAKCIYCLFDDKDREKQSNKRHYASTFPLSSVRNDQTTLVWTVNIEKLLFI